MCGISGIISYSNKPIIKDLLQSIYYIQHRGQDSYGFTTINNNNNNLCVVKKQGLIDTDTINITKEDELYGNVSTVGVGHVRYPTTGSKGDESIQPFHKESLIMAHNGQIKVKPQYRAFLKGNGIKLEAVSDSELLLTILLFKLSLSSTITTDIIRKLLKDISDMLDGSYSIILYIKGYGMIAIRDKYGIKPLIVGVSDNTYLVSSESTSLKSLNYKILGDVKPGEAIIFNNDYKKMKFEIEKINYVDNAVLRPCIFEWVYVANVTSIVDGVSVYDARLNMGSKLAGKISDYFYDNNSFQALLTSL